MDLVLPVKMNRVFGEHTLWVAPASADGVIYQSYIANCGGGAVFSDYTRSMEP